MVLRNPSIELQRIRSGGWEVVRDPRLDLPALEGLRPHGGNRVPRLQEDDVPLAEHLEHEIVHDAPVETEHRDAIEPLLSDFGNPRVVDRFAESGGERRQGLWSVLRVVKCEPFSGFAKEFRALAAGHVDAEDHLVLRLVDLVDVPSDEPLPFRDEGHEVEGCDCFLHGPAPKRTGLLIDAAGGNFPVSVLSLLPTPDAFRLR